MSNPFEAARCEDGPQLFTIEGLASSFGISPAAIRKYILWGHVAKANGRRHDGFNYDISHYRQIKQLRAKKMPLSHGRNPHAHVIVVARGERQGAIA